MELLKTSHPRATRICQFAHYMVPPKVWHLVIKHVTKHGPTSRADRIPHGIREHAHGMSMLPIRTAFVSMRCVAHACFPSQTCTTCGSTHECSMRACMCFAVVVVACARGVPSTSSMAIGSAEGDGWPKWESLYGDGQSICSMLAKAIYILPQISAALLPGRQSQSWRRVVVGFLSGCISTWQRPCRTTWATWRVLRVTQ